MGGAGNAFEDAVHPLLPRARRVARRVLAKHALAEEAVQEALLRAFRFWNGRRETEVWPWLRSLVIRECLRASSRDAAGYRGAPAEAAAETPEEVALRREEHAEARQALQGLPDGYRRVLLLRHGCCLTEAEVGPSSDCHWVR